MPPLDIPGFCYNEERRKYFKILPNHVLSLRSDFSNESAQRKGENDTGKQQTAYRIQRNLDTRVQPSRILIHALGGDVALKRELGEVPSSMSHCTSAWAQGLKKNEVAFARTGIKVFLHDEATGNLILATPVTGEGHEDEQ